MKCYAKKKNHLSRDQVEEIYLMKLEGHKAAHVARVFGRALGTVRDVFTHKSHVKITRPFWPKNPKD